MSVKTLKVAMGALVVVLVPLGAYAQDNFSALEQMKNRGAQVRTLSAKEDQAIQGANWRAVKELMKLNVRIYGFVGWEIGRLVSIKQYGVDPGRFPGLWQALTGRF